MKNFSCTSCGGRVYFENVLCLACESALAFDASPLSMVALPLPDDGREPAGYCANHGHGVCNWLADPTRTDGFCVACGLNSTIPNLQEAGSLAAWADLERAKKRLIYSLLRLGLSFDASSAGKGHLTFAFMRKTTTGHLDGVITVDIREADSVERERQRQRFDEPYRSLLGHLRHESGHFYWMLLVEGAGQLDRFRAVFGDERQDYGQALSLHHSKGPVPEWQSRFVSAYASAHPWEDWAETWAHYLHILDTLDTAEAVGMEPRAAGFTYGLAWPFKSTDVYRESHFRLLSERWIPLTLALNRLSRSMGQPDFYPFVIPAPAYAKLALIHDLVREGASR